MPLEFFQITTILDKIFETKSSFYVKDRTTGRVQFLYFSSILLVLTKLWFWEEDWAQGYNCMKFWDFPGLSCVFFFFFYDWSLLTVFIYIWTNVIGDTMLFSTMLFTYLHRLLGPFNLIMLIYVRASSWVLFLVIYL